MAATTFNLEHTFDLVLMYHAGELPVDDVIEALDPLIRSVISKRFSESPYVDDIYSAMLERAFRIITGTHRFEEAHSLLGLMVKSLFFCGLTTIKKCTTQQFDFDEACASLPNGILPSQKDVYRKMVVKSVYDEVYYNTIDKIRLWGDRRKACLDFIRQMHESGDFMSSPWIMSRYSLSEEEVIFIKQYATVLFKSTMYDVRTRESAMLLSQEWENRLEACHYEF